MSNGVVPIGKILYVCDDVLQDATSNKLHVLGAFDAVRIPADAAFPYSLPQLCVFAQLVGGRGTLAFRAIVVDASTGDEVFGSPTYSVNAPGGHTILNILIRMEDCRFPHAGTYLVQLFCNQDFIDDRRLTVR